MRFKLLFVHEWLDGVYGRGAWRIDYEQLYVKTMMDASLFVFVEQRSGQKHSILVIDRDVTDVSGNATQLEPPTGEADGGFDLAVITILPEEFEAVLSCLDSHEHVRGSPNEPNIYSWEAGTVRAHGGRYRVVVALAGDPTTAVGAVVTLATIERFKPRYVVLVGVAGGLAPDLKRGDVVVSRLVHKYEYGKIDGGFQPRTNFTHRVDPGLANAAEALISTKADWWSGIQAPPPHSKRIPQAQVGAIASGDKVVDDVNDAFFAAVLQTWPKLIAVEMEGAGAAIAIEAAQAKGRQTGFAMIRGISDMPGTDAGGTAERDAWKRYAAEAAARFLILLLRTRWPVEPLRADADRL